MEEGIIVDSFNRCGLTSSNPEHFHEFIEDLIDDDNDDDMMAYIESDRESLEGEDDLSEEENGNDNMESQKDD
jgi:hypothetical protein